MKKLTLILSLLIALVGLNANAAMYIVGDAPFGGWNPNGGVQMTDNGGGIYTHTATINGTVFFVFGDGQANWDTFNPNHRYGPADGNEAVTVGVWKTTQKAGDHGAYFFEGSGDDYVFTFDENTHQFKVEGYVAPIVITTYTVVSGLDGEGWPILESNDMTLVNGVYTLTRENVELTAGTLAYKVVGNHDWGHEWPQGYGNNFTQTIPANGTYDITFTFDPETGESTCTLTLVGEAGESYYIVAGTENLFGSNWNANDEANRMTEGEDGIFTWTKKDFEAAAGTEVMFKVVANGNWATCWPLSDENGDNNWYYKFEEAGTYDVVITFNEETKDINLVATKVGEPPVVEDYYIVAGTQNLFGSNWNITDEDNLMTEGEDGIFTWTKKDFEATAGTEVMFKVVANGSWDTCWPLSDENGDNNWYYKFEEDGVYTVVITFNEETKDINLVATRTGDLPDVPPTVDNVYIIGDVNEIGWSATEGIQMTYDETNKVYTAEITTQNQGDLSTAYFGFTKMLAEEDTDGAWDVIEPYRFGPVSNGAFVMTDQLLGQSIELDLVNGSYESVAIPAGTWTVTVDLVNAILKIEGVWPYYDGDVYILGEVDGNSWAPNVGVLMRKSGNSYRASVHTDGTPDGYSYFSFSKTLATNEGNNGWAEIAGSRFGAVTDGNPFTVTDEMLDQTLDLVMAADPMAFQIPAGDWILNVDVDRMTLVISDARGDVNLDAAVNIQDVTALINYLLSKNANGISLGNANCNKDQAINISDVTTLINFLLSKQWPAE